jgi:hypothetical protein
MLAGGVRVIGVEREALEDVTADRPCPPRRRGHEEHEQEDDRNEPAHGTTALLSSLKTTEADGSNGVGCCQS